MNPFYFGSNQRRLFGIYEPAATDRPTKRAAVLCYPWGGEYLYSHRAMCKLAKKLSAAGFHTLRFDFFGTGDSVGDMTEADLAGWRDDVELAVEELTDIVGARSATLIGLRLGAVSAAGAAAKQPSKADALVLWDPIVFGQEYIHYLGVSDRTAAELIPADPAASAPMLEINGFPLTTALMRDVGSIDLTKLIFPPPVNTLMLITERLASHDAMLAPQAGQGEPSPAIEFLPSPSPWLEDTTKTGIIPVSAIQRIVDWLG